MPDQRETTAVTKFIYPWQADAGPGCRQVYIGAIEPGSGAYCHDPWDLYERGVVSSPNLMAFGEVGFGKSATFKAYVARQMVHGRRAWCLDPKGEYGPLAEAMSAAGFRVARIVLDPTAPDPVRINPMDPAVPAKTRMSLLSAVTSAALGRKLTPREKRALSVAHREALRFAATEGPLSVPGGRGRAPLLADVALALLYPTPEQAAAMAARGGVGQAHDEARDVGLALLDLVELDLAGLFDGPTTEGLDLDAQLVVIDVSALAVDPKDDGALAVAMACVTTFLQGQLERQGVDGNLIVVLDEAWRFMRLPAMAEWLSGAFKLVRKYGAQFVCIFHRLTDLDAAGLDGSQQRNLVKGLREDCQMQVMFSLPEFGASNATTLLGLSAAERAVIRNLGHHQAVWRIKGHATCVRTVIEHGGFEWDFIVTDQAMAAGSTR